MYGVELHKAKDNANKEIQLGVMHLGLVVFQKNIRINVFSWSKIMKISFKRKQFFIQLRREPVRSTFMSISNQVNNFFTIIIFIALRCVQL